MKIYIIQKIGYEYNDEYYDRPESDGGTPIEAYKNKKKADEVCKELNKTAEKLGNDKWDDEKQETGYWDEYYKVVEVELEK